MISPPALVYLVDDEPAVLKAIARLLRSTGHHVESFPSAREFLDGFHPDKTGCAILDLSMPEMNGIELQHAVAKIDPTFPIIFLSGNSDVQTGIKAMKGGAVDFLSKPVSDDILLSAIEQALERSRIARQTQTDHAQMRERLAKLTPREYEVMTHLIAGKLNKQIAVTLGTVEKTIKVHRASIMLKAKVNSLAELVRLTERAGIEPAK